MTEPTLKNLTQTNYGAPKNEQNELLQTLGEPHTDSFNYMLEEGLDDAVNNLTDMEFDLPNDERVRLTIENATIYKPRVPPGCVGVKNPNIYPTECRQRKETYKGKLSITIGWSLNDVQRGSFVKDLGEIPIMVKSKACHLDNLSPADLINRSEHAEEWGGYFVVKGHERLIRMLLVPRRNFPTTIKRTSWKTRGRNFSDMGLLTRCVAQDQTTTNNTLHFVYDGSVKFMFSHSQCMYYIPLILMMKCLTDHTDKYLYDCLVRGYEDDTYYIACIQNMLRSLHEDMGLHTPIECREHVGGLFRQRVDSVPSWSTNSQVTEYILGKDVLIHLENNEDKFQTLVFMTQKLFSFVQNKCKLEGGDSVMMQELLLGGHLYLQIIKDKLQNFLLLMKGALLKRYRTVSSFVLNQSEITFAAARCGTLEGQMANFISTGNIPSKSGFGLMQQSGLTIVAENINRMRYMSHFRAVHRGTFFQQMRTTEARQLLPDAWGFICPVHTPDGAPCGLLNHLTMHCKATPVVSKELINNIPKVLVNLGMIPMDSVLKINEKESYTISLDGRILGRFQKNNVSSAVDALRILKIEGKEIPDTLEIVFIPIRKICAQYPGLYLFSGPARMMRPVLNLAVNRVELIGTLEQVYLEIAVCAEETYPGVTTHMELSKISFLSNLANLIPMPDCNQSPRNMYQCQMGKQTMGTPLHYWNRQAETKLYRLQTPTSPLFRPVHHDKIDLDEFGMGTNAIVAVISYTGYDMEDAMIINKSSFERGFAHGSVYKTEFVTLEDKASYFCRNPNDPTLANSLDTDGLPHPGTRLKLHDPYYCYFNTEEEKYVLMKYKNEEEAIVDSVRQCGTFSISDPRTACIVIRISRNPSVGDKFASRAGQKGICSQKWPSEDLPWTETGLVPDIVFNPHGFPSRMTIAMMIECMAGKTASLHGLVHDATPFRFGEEDTAIDYFGRLLEAGGYNYFGTERLYSGIDGRELKADIFFGVVHYQRLRHMVSDKWQVRSTGPIDALTRQPIKGRKRGGGVRFGEMERDSLLAHGASFLLQDRLFHNSDKTTVSICLGCETILGPLSTILLQGERNRRITQTCKLCGNSDKIDYIQIPYIFKYLVTQLSAVNLNIKISCKKT